MTRLLTALTPFADGFVADAIALGNDARRLGGSCDLCSHRGGGSASSQHLITDGAKAPRVIRDSSPT
ncbi:hypothetical protein M2305_002127 [Gluconobacter cerinus]|nr:hypothetical protein [Gluconobacter cerinus]